MELPAASNENQIDCTKSVSKHFYCDCPSNRQRKGDSSCRSRFARFYRIGNEERKGIRVSKGGDAITACFRKRIAHHCDC